jgi:EAL domain-containing protein (putative c-di-GMP-specific phosphodiesterase class I)/ActR/RegA family two-component response regulator
MPAAWERIAQKGVTVPIGPGGSSTVRLLVVDDEAVPRLLVARAAATLGIVTDGAASLAQARVRLAEIPYDVVVLDLALREHDGVEVLRALRDVGSDAVLVLFSGFNERVRQAAARLAGALGLRVAGTLGKPLRVDALLALLRRLPERSPAERLPAAVEVDARALARGIDNDEIVCLFQPEVALRGRQVVGLEVLARWRSPSLGLVRPDFFIPVAERTGLIDRLTGHILAKALPQFRAWLACCPGLSLAVNLSPLCLVDLALPERVSAALAASGVPAEALVLEVTEGAVLRDEVAAADILTRLRIRGVRLSIDDFGTGHSSLLSLLHLPFSEIKIDQRFVATCARDPEASKIIRAIVSLARELDVQLVAEGIESEPVAELLTSLGCAVGQGYLFAPPLPAAALTDWLVPSSASRQALAVSG